MSLHEYLQRKYNLLIYNSIPTYVLVETVINGFLTPTARQVVSKRLRKQIYWLIYLILYA